MRIRVAAVNAAPCLSGVIYMIAEITVSLHNMWQNPLIGFILV